MRGISVRVEPSAEPPHPASPTPTMGSVTLGDTASQGPASKRSVHLEHLGTLQVSIS